MDTQRLRYEQLADELGDMIERRILRPGDRLPSVRRLAQDKRVSVSTVLQALRRLERGGRVEARPQSGYFVLARATAPLVPSARLNNPTEVEPVSVDISSRLMHVLAATHRADVVQFGAALPATSILPMKHLQRLYSQHGRRAETLLDTSSHTAINQPALVRQIVRHSITGGRPLQAEEIVITNSCTESLALCLRTVTRPGDTVAVECPAYSLMLQLLENLGLQALEIPTHPETGMSVDALDVATRDRKVAACLLVSTFSNPLGCLMPDTEKARLAEMMAARGIPVIEDDIFGDLYFGSRRPWPIKTFDTAGNVMLCSSFSKTLSPSLRLGYVAGGRYVNQLLVEKTLNAGATNPITQAVVASFMESSAYDRHLRTLRRALAGQSLNLAEAVLRAFPPGTRISHPPGGLVLWVELPGKGDGQRLYDRALAAGIAIMPGDLFSASGRYRHCIRLSCGQPWSPRLETAIQTLGRLAADVVRGI